MIKLKFQKHTTLCKKIITLVQNLNRDVNLTFKWKHSNLLKNAFEILISICETALFTANSLTLPLKTARDLLFVPVWALGPTADGWATEPAQRRNPPGLFSTHSSG
jgi:hypothetical protein